MLKLSYWHEMQYLDYAESLPGFGPWLCHLHALAPWTNTNFFEAQQNSKIVETVSMN